ncbi:MAG: SPOR domain-containing protein [Pseudomonadota bacterium]
MAKKTKNADLDDIIFSVPRRLERLWDEIRVPLFWSTAAVISMGILVSLSVTQKGGERLAQIPYDMQDLIQKQNPGASLSAALDKRMGSVRDENLELAAARTQLETRVAQLEDSLGDITASIPQTAKIAPAVPNTATTVAPSPKELAALNKTLPQGDELAAKGHLTLATRSEFGIDLGGYSSLRAARDNWIKMMEQYGAIMTGYEPVITARDGGDTVSLHLVVGPFSNITDAAAACAKLRAAGMTNCAPASYDGQRLALR